MKHLIGILVLSVLLGGCSSGHKHESATEVETIFTTDAPIQIVVSTHPLEAAEVTLESIRAFFSEMLGLETQVRKVDLEIPADSDMTGQTLFKATTGVLERATGPTVVIVTVKAVADSRGYGFCIPAKTTLEDGTTWPVAVVVLIRKDGFAKHFESTLLMHEIGHWVGVPAGGDHLYKDHSHCSSMRCVMMPGPGTNVSRWLGGVGLSALFLSPPGFCERCKHELAAMKRQHEAIREN